MMREINQTYCGNHFTGHTNIKSSCRTPETSLVICQLYLNKKHVVLSYWIVIMSTIYWNADILVCYWGTIRYRL